MPRALPISYSITHMECAAGSVRRFQFLSSNYRMASEANPSHNFPFADNSRVILSRRNGLEGSGWVAYGSRACEAVHAGRIVRWIRPRRRFSAAHHATDASAHKTNIGDIASHCRRRPAVTLENVENLFAFQSIGSLHVAD